MPDTAGPLAGKVALVTGASSGIGRATALALSAAGADVAVGARRTDRLEKLVAELEAGGGGALALELDVTDEAGCAAAVDRTVGELGRLDVVVNNAGVMLLGTVEDADHDEWRRMIDTNVYGVLWMSAAALPHLVETQGALVQVSSVAGRVARAGSAVYNASKWAVNGFSEGLRQEVTGRGVRVIVIEPGMTQTELRDHITQEGAKQRIAERAAGMRQLQAEDIAAAIVYAVTAPDHVAVNEILIRPTDQEN